MLTPVPDQPIVRRSAYANGGGFADQNLLWYARGVAAMQKRPLADRTSWRFYAAIHGFDQTMWQNAGFWRPTEQQPTSGDRDTFWTQCAHGSWFFLPWHRGYLLAFEAVLRQAIRAAGGPADWALPYWDYFSDPELPPAFTRDAVGWPGPGPNPLFVARRFGIDGHGVDIGVDLSASNLNAMSDEQYAEAGTGGSPGFGGRAIDQFGSTSATHGHLESNPHDHVHTDVGGMTAAGVRGLMTRPRTAGLDPIFWLHHANIDRLWEAWLHNPLPHGVPPHRNPDEKAWLRGPSGPRDFAMPLPGNPGAAPTTWTYTPETMQDLTTLNYSYDDLEHGTQPPVAGGAFARLQRLGADVEGAPEDVAREENVELAGANDEPLDLQRPPGRTVVRLDGGVRDKVTASLAAAPEGEAPDRVFLNLENIRGDADGVTLRVYVGLPDGAAPEDHPEALAGSVALFGVGEASRVAGEHGGDGLTSVLEISSIVGDLHLRAGVPDELSVVVVPRAPLPPGTDISIGRISVFRQGR